MIWTERDISSAKGTFSVCSVSVWFYCAFNTSYSWIRELKGAQYYYRYELWLLNLHRQLYTSLAWGVRHIVRSVYRKLPVCLGHCVQYAAQLHNEGITNELLWTQYSISQESGYIDQVLATLHLKTNRLF